MQNNASFLSLLEQRCVITRLLDEMREASREFRDDPRAYVAGALRRDIGGGRRKTLLRLGLAIGISVYAIALMSMIALWLHAQNQPRSGSAPLPLVMLKFPSYDPKVEMPKGDDVPGGGGGGGRGTDTLPSVGAIPIPSLADQMIAPRPEPQLTPPVLPVIETVKVDPRIKFNRDDLAPTGLPDGTGFAPSAGPGSDGGMGSGSKGGMGVGTGAGVGEGEDGNIGGKGFHPGLRPRGPGDQSIVDARPVLLNAPRPFYTEEARKNKVQGVVRVRVFVDASGDVRQVVVTRGLPDGLSEQAVRAAYQMRFRPAVKDGRQVSYWLSNVEIEFNLR
jgi:periplasmic protein TonB